MTNKMISDLPIMSGDLSDDDLMLIMDVSSGETKQVTLRSVVENLYKQGMKDVKVLEKKLEKLEKLERFVDI